jgi:poly-gamma-glutamate capsule biosynthesis protein CapA/YwtB (metallophosphatase superfamily)
MQTITGFKNRSSACMAFLGLILLMLTLSESTRAANCSGELALPPKLPAATPRLLEVVPFSGVAKNWTASAAMKSYFDLQRSVLMQLHRQGLPKNVSASGQPIVRFGAVGDIMRMPSDQPNYMDRQVLRFLNSKDVLVGNLETLISPRFPVPPDSLFVMNSDPSLLTALRRPDGGNSFSALSLANNHAFDFDDRAIDDTLSLLRKEKIPFSGLRETASEKPYVTLERNGIRIGYFAVSTFVNRPDLLEKTRYLFNPIIPGLASLPFQYWLDFCEIDLKPVTSVMEQMRASGIEVIVLSVHWGHEHDMYPQPVQVQLAHALARAGADIIVGAHTHTPQPMEACFVNGAESMLPRELAESVRQQGCTLQDGSGQPRKTMIYYSLGNFTSYTPLFWQQVGTIAELNLVRDQAGRVDWFQPGIMLTYDDVTYAPHGQRRLRFLRDYVSDQCGETGTLCGSYLPTLADYAQQHLLLRGLNEVESMHVLWHGLRQGIGGLLDAYLHGN